MQWGLCGKPNWEKHIGSDHTIEVFVCQGERRRKRDKDCRFASSHLATGLVARSGNREFKYGAPGEIRTPDPLVRSQVLYPAELRARRERHDEIQALEENAF
jgi:hypothetical protein